MPKLILPEEKVITSQGGERSIAGNAAATASAAKIGQLTSNDAANAVAQGAKIGQITRTQAADALAQSGEQIGNIIMKDEAAGAAAYAQIGMTAIEAGKSINEQGKQMFDKAMNSMGDYIEKSRAAVEDGIYNNTYSDAALEFNQRVTDRLAKPYDDQGNPTFGSLSSDIGAIGEDIKANYSGKLGNNPEVLDRFNRNFTNVVTNQQINAMKEARGQQIEYSKGSLEKFLNTNTVSALSVADRSTLPQYMGQAEERIDSAYKNGYISYEQAVQLKDKSRHDIAFGSLENQAQKDPNSVYNMLGMDSTVPGMTNEQLGITPTERAKLVDITARRIAAQRNSDRIRVSEEKALVREQQTFHRDNLELGIDQGVVSDPDIDAYYNDGKISHSQMIDLKQKTIVRDKQGSSKASIRQAISTDINKGNLIGNKYSSSAINDHYNRQIETSGAQELFDTKQPMDRTRLAAQYRTPVTAYTNELDSVARGGTPEQVIKAAQSYKYVSTKSPMAVSRLNKQSAAFYNTVNSQLKYGNIDPATAIERAKNLVFNAKEDDYVIRRNESDNKNSPFSNSNIDKTISEMNWGDQDYRSDTYSSLKHWLGPNDKISSFAKSQITKQLRDAYVLTGSYEAAKEMVQNESQGVFGTSAMNNMSNWTRDSSVLMFAPPEATYGPGTPTNYSSQEMRANLEHDVSALLIDGPYAAQQNIKPEQIMVGSGEFTARQVGGAKYMMYYVDDSGQEHPIVNPNTGQAQFWSPDGGYISEYRAEQTQKEFDRAYKVQTIKDQSSVTGGVIKGLISKGNINLDNRVVVRNSDGSISTEKSITITEDNKAVLIPTIIKGKAVSNEEAIQYYKETGENLGKFDTEKSADQYAESLHKRQESRYVPRSLLNDSNTAPHGSQQAVVNTALSFIGVSEHGHRQQLGSVMSRMIGRSIDPAQTPWCAAFVNTVLRANGMEGTGSLAARSFLNYGRPTNNPTKGDIVVMSRGGDTSKGHVGFYMGRDSNGNILVLGGNQSDSVNIKVVNPNKVLSIRALGGNSGENISVSTNSVPQKEVLGYRQLPNADQAQDLFTTGELSNLPNKALPVGIRQNNPGNITKNGARWQGEVPNASTRFKEFASPEDGIGAMVSNLSTNYFPKGVNTIEKIVKKWTATQKDWSSYIKNLSEATGLKPNEKFDFGSLQPNQIVGLIQAMIKQENGYNPYPNTVIMNGILRARGGGGTIQSKYKKLALNNDQPLIPGYVHLPSNGKKKDNLET